MRKTSILCVAIFVAFSMACGGGNPTERDKDGKVARVKPADEQKVYSREEFTKLLRGKTPDEVIKAVGKPESTSEAGGVHFWHYRARTRDAVTGKLDDDAQVVFEHGVVDSVNY